MTSRYMSSLNVNATSTSEETSPEGAEQVWHSENVMLMRRPGGVTVIAFAGIAQAFGGMPPFNFMRAMRNATANVIFVRDPHSKWFGNPIAGLGNNPREMSLSLQRLAAELGTQEVCLLGISAGAFAAMLFSTLLDYPCRVLAFSPQTCIAPAFLAKIGDRRYLKELRGRLDQEFDDLVPLVSAVPSHLRFDVVLGLHDPLDTRHIQRLEGLSNIHIHRLHCGHNTAGHLKQRRLLRDTLLTFVQGDSGALTGLLACANAA